jgi:hypothetical protein
LLSVVDDDLAKALAKETVAILGDLTLPNNGILFSLDVVDLIGLQTN